MYFFKTTASTRRPPGSGRLAGVVNLFQEFRSLGPAQRRAFAAAFLGWMLDGFDFTILTFVLADIQRHFSVNSALAGALQVGEKMSFTYDLTARRAAR